MTATAPRPDLASIGTDGPSVAPGRWLRARGPQERTSLLGGGIMLGLIPAIVLVPQGESASFDRPLGPTIALLFLGFVISERLVFHIESRNEAVSFSPADVPLAIGIVVLSPLALVGVRIIAGAVGLLIWRRQPLFKLTLNLVAFTTEVVVATTIFRLATGSAPTPALSTWLVLVLSLQIALVCGGVIIATAISFFERDFASRVRKELTHSYLFYLPGALVGGSTAIPMLIEPWLTVVTLVPAPLIWIILRSHGALMHSFSDLRHIHEFSSQVARSTRLDEIAETAVTEIAGHLRADTVELAVWDAEGSQCVEARVGGKAVLTAISPTLQRMGVTDEPLHITRTTQSPLADRLRALDIEEAVVVVLGEGNRAIGAMVIADRSGAVDFFVQDDLDRLVPIAQQLTVALLKGQLHIQIQHQATHDRLTGLPNRTFFEAWTDETVERREQLAILLVDLDRFKEVNDTLGHHVGDQLLIEAGIKLRHCLAEGDMLARLGGDEFAIVSPGATADEASLLAESISMALEEPFELAATTVSVAASTGIALYPAHGLDRSTLLRRADLAMYEAKRSHQRARLYSPDLESINTTQLSLLGALRDAVRDGSIDVYFQPKVSLATGATVGAEALARWTDPIHGSIPPDVFVPLAEQAGLIEELTHLVVDRSVAAVASWASKGAAIGVAVNLSPNGLLNDDLPEQISFHLRRYQVPANLLTLEITERCVMTETPRVRDILERLDELGVRISVDDFGTGHSSLVNLRHLPVRELKIDRGFVIDMLRESNDEVIVRSTVDLAHNLGLEVVAEGVETLELFVALRAVGCDLAQGYGIARPMPLAEFTSWHLGRCSELPELDLSEGRPFVG